MKKILFGLLALVTVAGAHNYTFTENFTANPLTNGWQIFGNTNLFHWDPTNHNLAVTWDSSQPNSYFYHALSGFTTDGEFGFSFDLTLRDAAIAGGTFQIAAGMFNLANATNAGFLRGTGFNSTNEVEFDYFLDPVFGDSVAATIIDTNGYFADVYDDVALNLDTTYHVSVTHFSGDTLISSQVTVSNQLYSAMPNAYVEAGFGNFDVDTLAVMSYSDTGAGASILAHGTIGNVFFTTTPNPVVNLTGQYLGQIWQAKFQSFTNWNYTLERSTNLAAWVSVSGAVSVCGNILELPDTNAPPGKAFYRVHAQR